MNLMVPFVPYFIIQLWIAFHTPIESPVRIIEVTPIENRSVLDSVRQEYSVTTGFVCFSNDDIQCIYDVCNDPEKHLYWSINLNGDYSKVNSQTILKESDYLRLEYASLKEK